MRKSINERTQSRLPDLHIGLALTDCNAIAEMQNANNIGPRRHIARQRQGCAIEHILLCFDTVRACCPQAKARHVAHQPGILFIRAGRGRIHRAFITIIVMTAAPAFASGKAQAKRCSPDTRFCQYL